MRTIRNKIKGNFPRFHRFYRTIKFNYRTLFVPRLRTIRQKEINKIAFAGSEHGWAFVERKYLFNSVVISVGLGEDASFDVDFCNKYGARLLIVDPTPQSIVHFQAITSNFGMAKRINYVQGGKQPVESYELSKISAGKFDLIPKALWIKTGWINFYVPKNPDHTSFSITNIQGTSASIEVPSVTYHDLLIETGIDEESVRVLKLDIEGAATEVLSSLIKEGYRPNQILVEFEEVFVFSIRNLLKLRRVTKLLGIAGYQLMHTNFIANFTYEYFEEVEVESKFIN